MDSVLINEWMCQILLTPYKLGFLTHSSPVIISFLPDKVCKVAYNEHVPAKLKICLVSREKHNDKWLLLVIETNGSVVLTKLLKNRKKTGLFGLEEK